MKEFFHEVLLHGIKDTVLLFPILFVTYLLAELAEHKYKEKSIDKVKRAGKLGPLFGGLLGALPQCSFSAMSSGLYASSLISVGTLVAVFLSTSDEMIAVMLSSSVARPENVGAMIKILSLKIVCAIAVGFAVDLVYSVIAKRRGYERKGISDFCESEGCGCESHGIVYASFIHSLKIFGFIFAVTVVVNTAIFFIGEDNLGLFIKGTPILGELLCAIFGLIPNCASSIVLTELYLEGVIGASQLLAGLFTASGVGVLVLFRTNKSLKENLLILATLYVTGVLLGILIGYTGLAAILGI